MLPDPSANRRALLLMAAAMTLLPANDAIMKGLGASLPTGQMMSLRGVILSLLVLAGSLALRQPVTLAGLLNPFSLARALCELISTYLFLSSLTSVPLGIATTLVFSAPLLLTAVSGPLFGERVGPWRWGAVLGGFAGVLLVTAPGSEVFQPAVLKPIGAAVFMAVRDVVTRYIPPRVPSASVTFTTAAMVALGGLLSLPAGWATVTGGHWLWLALAAVLLAAAFLCHIVAMRTGELSLIAPAQYLIILWAVFWGAAVWGEIPGTRELVGGSIIVAAGLVILYRERVRGSVRAAGTPVP